MSRKPVIEAFRSDLRWDHLLRKPMNDETMNRLRAQQKVTMFEDRAYVLVPASTAGQLAGGYREIQEWLRDQPSEPKPNLIGHFEYTYDERSLRIGRQFVGVSFGFRLAADAWMFMYAFGGTFVNL